MDKILGMPDISTVQDLSTLKDKEKEIYAYIQQDWPTTALEIAENCEEIPADRDAKRRLSTKYSYYIKKLVQQGFIISKKAGNTTIIWPLSVEKFRAVQDILRD